MKLMPFKTIDSIVNYEKSKNKKTGIKIVFF